MIRLPVRQGVEQFSGSQLMQGQNGSSGHTRALASGCAENAQAALVQAGCTRQAVRVQARP